MLQFVLHGEPDAVVHEVNGLGILVRELRLMRRYAHGEAIEFDIYDQFEDVPVDIALRYARLLDALGPPHALLRLQLPPGLRWPEVLMVHASSCPIEGYSSFPPKPASLSVARLESMLVAAGHEPGALLASAFATPVPTDNTAQRQLCEQRLAMTAELEGYADALDRHCELVRPLMLPAATAQRRHVVNMLDKASPATLARLAPELCELAMTASQPVQTGAEALLRRVPEAAIGPLRTLAAKGSPKRRAQAQQLLTRCVESGVHVPLAHRVAELPVIDWSPAAHAVAPGFLAAFWRRVNHPTADGDQCAPEHAVQGTPKALGNRSSKPYDEDDAWALQAYLASVERRAPKQPRDRDTAWKRVAPVLEEMAGEGLTPVALLKMLMFFNLAGDKEAKLEYPAVRAFNALHRRTGRPTLLELACMMGDAGLSGAALRRNYCNTWDTAIAEDWAPEAVWPFFMHHAESVAFALLDSRNNEPEFRPGLFPALRLLPTLPDAVEAALFQLALGPGKTDRLAAQETLSAYPGKEGRILSALGDGKAGTRAAAAEWLGRLRHRPAVGALKEALAKEKQGAARSPMLDALETMGEPTS